MADTYQGWANYQTWNVALWIGNDEGLYNMAREYSSYEDFAQVLKDELNLTITGDGVSYTDPTLDHDELDNMLRELNE